MPSATLTAPERPALGAVLETVVRELVAGLDPAQIWLFGSHAWGAPDADSDLDLLVVVKDDADTSIQAVRRARRCLRGVDMAKDVILQRKSDFERFKEVPSTLSRKIAKEGRLIHGAG